MGRVSCNVYGVFLIMYIRPQIRPVSQLKYCRGIGNYVKLVHVICQSLRTWFITTEMYFQFERGQFA